LYACSQGGVAIFFFHNSATSVMTKIALREKWHCVQRQAPIN